MKANVETRRDEYTFLGSGCNIRTHLLRAAARPRVYFIEIWARGGSREERTVRMRPGGKSNGESPFFETPNLSFEGRVGILAGGRTGANTRNTSQRTSRANHENSNNHWVVPECGESAESGDGEIQVLAAAAELGGVCCCDPTPRDTARHCTFPIPRGPRAQHTSTYMYYNYM